MKLIDRLKELDAKATPGPWQSVEYGVHSRKKAIAGRGFGPLIDNHVCDTVICDQSDAELIAASRNALPKLLAFVEAYDDWEENGGFYAQPGERLSDARRALDEENESKDQGPGGTWP